MLPSSVENMTLCGPTEPPCGVDCKSYSVPLSRCFSPSKIFPGDAQWGPFDIFDVCDGRRVSRSFYSSTDGSCRNRTDGFVIPTNQCVGPFGKPRPWGTFQCGAPLSASPQAPLRLAPLRLAPLRLRSYPTPDAYAAAVAASPGAYVSYRWPAAPQPLSSTMAVDHVWTSIPDSCETDGNGVFASSQMWWHADNGTELAGGYIGSQVLRGASGDVERRLFLFAIWDHSSANRVGWTTPATCGRFGGEGVGAHCLLDYPTRAGVLYNLSLARVGHNASGASWSAAVHDTSTGTSTTVGTLFLPHADESVVGYGLLGVYSNMFLEYFAEGGDCETAVHVGVGSFGPHFHTRAVSPLAASPAYGTGACNRTLVTGCVPGYGCGAPRVWIEGGRGVVRNNTDATQLW